MPCSLAFRQFFGYKKPKPKPNRGDSRTRQIRSRGGGFHHSCSADGMPRLDLEGHLTPSPKKDPILDTVRNCPH